MKTLRRSALLLGLAIVLPGLAMAGGFEKTTNFGARATSMGGAATAYNNNASAVFYNPALFKSVKTWSFGFDFLPTLIKTNANFSTLGDARQLDSNSVFLPIFNVAGAYRFSDQIVAGLGVYTPAGLKSRYEGVLIGGTASVVEVDFKVFEAAPFVVFEVTPDLAVSLQYRAIYATYSQTVGALLSHTSFSGTNFLGGRLGVSHTINDNWHWGLSVRSQIKANLTGTTTAPPLTNLSNQIRDVIYPWNFQLGAAYVADNHDWSVSADLWYTLYKQVDKVDFDANDAVLAGNEANFDITTLWRNTFKAMLGGELKVAENWFVRLGGGLHTTVTNPLQDSQLFAPPVTGISGATGAGYNTDTWGVDLSYDINFGRGTGTLRGATTATTHNATAHALGLSFNYKAM